ncbi:glycosyltransferase involved in cell wall biosynthesis [Paraburkholderia sp. GAS333]|uniref:glycosyltransferase family 2 protein n=1 Tax=Paraburkholderia sp. GAS333 TaxID=3156279 RepID=UPI003D1BA46A
MAHGAPDRRSKGLGPRCEARQRGSATMTAIFNGGFGKARRAGKDDGASGVDKEKAMSQVMFDTPRGQAAAPEKKPAVSVVLPVFNGEAHIAEAIDSMLAQTMTDFELLIINDGSTDGTREIVEDYAKRDKRIVLFNTPNQGIVAALNYGLDRAGGEFIARMDADDIAVPHRFELQLATLKREPEVVVCGGNMIKFGAVKGLLRFPRDDLKCRAALLFGTCFGHPSVMLRASTLRDHGLRYDAGYQFAEDYQFWTVLGRYGKLSNLGQPLVRYRIHDAQIGRASREPQRRVHLAIALLNWSDAGVRIDPDRLKAFLWPRLERLPDLYRYTLLFFRIAGCAVQLRGHRRLDYLWFAFCAFSRNAGRLILTGASA